MAYDTLLVSPETKRPDSPTVYDLATSKKAGKFRHWVREDFLISAVYMLNLLEGLPYCCRLNFQ